MTDFVFDFSHWVMWRQLLFWTVNALGLCSALIAFSAYNPSGKSNTSLWSALVFITMLVLLGLFPIEWGYGTDRANYANQLLQFKSGNIQVDFQKGEVGYQIIQFVLSRFLNATQFIFCISLIYLTNYYISIKRLVKAQNYWLFIAVILSMGFTNYALNTMRAGLAISFIVLGISMYKSRIKLICCIIIAVSIHTSALIPGGIILICSKYNNTRLFYKFWLLSIPVSFIAGGVFNTLFQSLSDDGRTMYLTTTETNYNVGFRIDFIIYSFAPMIIGAYYIFKKKINDSFYVMMYNAYLLTNMFWILVIRANYSDRFAYLSWFMMPFILVYPILTQKMHLNKRVWLGLILLGELAFRFI